MTRGAIPSAKRRRSAFDLHDRYPIPSWVFRQTNVGQRVAVAPPNINIPVDSNWRCHHDEPQGRGSGARIEVSETGARFS